MTSVYGIKNCDTIKKAIKWLNEHNIAFTFHDYRKDGLAMAWLENTEKQLSWEVMLNKKGTTFRQLSDQQKSNLDKQTALQLMLEQPAMIKRPILVHQQHYLCGFSAEQYQEIFKL
ncbi:MAG: ArsC family reductase [Paraglaciecola sp.]|uniref:ArsC family reductase n=1 Tax=Pseudomonadati TaxID=3379134 RepID=UPI00273D1A4F|nr:ArsC family reductase [Paraglaciecola sp.]MDP5031229.1 ArsC family reductase [Paraglaciecola sp.]MDP5134108.1 ArsC family reductase [Paraglaciecola sp.]